MHAVQVPIFTCFVEWAYLPPVARVRLGLPLQQNLSVRARAFARASHLHCTLHTLIAPCCRTHLNILHVRARCTIETPEALARGPPALRGAQRRCLQYQSLPRSLPPGATAVQRQAAKRVQQHSCCSRCAGSHEVPGGARRSACQDNRNGPEWH